MRDEPEGTALGPPSAPEVPQLLTVSQRQCRGGLIQDDELTAAEKRPQDVELAPLNGRQGFRGFVGQQAGVPQ